MSALEDGLVTRVLDALLREDYGGLRRYVHGSQLRLPGGPAVPLEAGRPGFLSDLTVAPGSGLGLEDVLAAVRRVADPRDDVASFARECREALATLVLHEKVKPEVLGRLAARPVTGPGTYYEALAAYNDHPVYPTGRCRVGLGEEDLRRYAPEFAPRFAMRWVAVPRERVTQAGERPGWWPGPADVGLDASLGESCELFPVHPLTPCDGPAPRPYLEVSPTLSMRTVAVDAATHLKVPLPTSTLGLRNRRSIVPGTLPDGALVERILRRVLDREPHLPVLVADEQTYGHAGSASLGYLVRRFPERTRDAHVVPVAALLAEEPGGRRVIERWDVAELFGRYLETLFAWNVALFRYGIALEAHQQNVSLLLRDRLDERVWLLVKDNDGALIDLERLTAALGPGPYDFADPRMVTRDREALARVFVTITLHLCAGAVAFGLAERGLLPLRQGLGLVRDRLAAALGPRDGYLRARTLDAARLPAKAMLTAGTLVDKARTGAPDINKHYGPDGPNYLDHWDDTCS